MSDVTLDPVTKPFAATITPPGSKSLTNRALVLAALEEIARAVGAEKVVHDERVARVSIVGVGMRSHSGVAAQMFAALSKEGINIQMISTSEIAVSCVIEDKYTELAVRALHDAFQLGVEGVEGPAVTPR